MIYKTVDAKSLDKLQFTVNNLRKSTTYNFILQAFNNKGTGPPSNEITVKTLDKDPPSTPHLKISLVSATSATIMWSLPADSEHPTGSQKIDKK